MREYYNSRFVVPFKYSSLNNEFIVNKIKSKIYHSHKVWNEVNYIGECDLYSHVYSLFMKENCNSLDDKSLGAFFELNPAILRQPTLNIMPDITTDTIQCKLVRVGLSIFMNGIGLLWYQVEFNQSLNIESIIKANNVLKEISYSKNEIYILRIQKKKIEGTPILFNRNGDNRRIIYGTTPIKYISESSIPVNMKKNSEIKILCQKNSLDNLYVEYQESIKFSLKQFINNLLHDVEIKSFFANRKSSQTTWGFSPDKAHIFTFHSLFENNLAHKLNFTDIKHLYLFSTGYPVYFQVPNNLINEIRKNIFTPADNLCWYFSIEGCGCFAYCNDRKTIDFFRNNYLDRLEFYFYIYILVLFQYYTLLDLMIRISEFPNQLETFNLAEDREKLEECKRGIAFFRMKIMFVQISHITLYNQVYKRLQDVYKIEESLNEVQRDMDAVSNIARQVIQENENKRQNRRDNFLLFFSVIGSILVITEVIDCILNIYNRISIKNYISAWTFSLLIFSFAGILGFIIWIGIKRRN